MEKRKILILTEGGGSKGLGHLARCSALAQAFSQRGAVVRFLVDGDNCAVDALSGYDLMIVDWMKLPLEVVDQVRGSDICIVDSYAVNAQFCGMLRRIAKFTVYIDDNARLDYFCDALVNPNIYAPRLRYKNKKSVEYFLGARYALLRCPFWKLQAKKINSDVRNIMITFGGSDDSNRTLKVVKLLKDKYPEVIKHVVIGKGFKPENIKKLQQSAESTVKLIYYPDAKKMKDAMSLSDIAVSAAGQTLYELAATGTPAAIVCVADNQERNAAAWKSRGFLVGDIEKNIKRLMPYKMRHISSARVSSIVDGHGAFRVTDVLLELFRKKETLRARPMGPEDCRKAWLWRNSFQARVQSCSQNTILYSKHKVWFAQKLKDKKVKLYMVENDNNEQIGQMRFDFSGAQSLASVSLNPDYYGMGFGARVIKTATERFIKEKRSVKMIIAQIKPENIASIKAFTKAGYGLQDNSGISKEELMSYVYKR